MLNLLRGKTAKRVLVATALPFALLACSTQAQDKSADHNKNNEWESRWSSGKVLYEKVCGQCHDPSVGVGTAIQGRDLPASYVQFIVRNGFNAMPAFPASYIDDESIAKVAEYLSTLPAPAAQP